LIEFENEEPNEDQCNFKLIYKLKKLTSCSSVTLPIFQMFSSHTWLSGYLRGQSRSGTFPPRQKAMLRKTSSADGVKNSGRGEAACGGKREWGLAEAGYGFRGGDRSGR
jgi:hypothetical protein